MRRAVADALSTVLPSEEETLLLRAALHDSDSGHEAWVALRARLGDPLDLFRPPRAHLRALGPLLHEALRRHEPDPDDRALLTVLRTAAVREEARERALRAAMAEAFGEAADVGAPVLVLKGAALAELAYPRPSLRHTDDVDVWGTRDETRAHASGIAIRVHHHLFGPPVYLAAEEVMRARAVGAEVAGVPVRVLAPADLLAHVCVLAASIGGGNVAHWVPDAWFALPRVTDAGWDELVASARGGRLALALSCTLGWLAETLGAAVPSSVLATLGEAAGEAGPAERDAALACAWAARGRGPAGLGTAAGRRRLGSLARWAVFPAPEYLRATCGVRGPAGLLWAYVARPWRFVRAQTSRASR